MFHNLVRSFCCEGLQEDHAVHLVRCFLPVASANSTSIGTSAPVAPGSDNNQEIRGGSAASLFSGNGGSTRGRTGRYVSRGSGSLRFPVGRLAMDTARNLELRREMRRNILRMHGNLQVSVQTNDSMNNGNSGPASNPFAPSMGNQNVEQIEDQSVTMGSGANSGSSALNSDPLPNPWSRNAGKYPLTQNPV